MAEVAVGGLISVEAVITIVDFVERKWSEKDDDKKETDQQAAKKIYREQRLEYERMSMELMNEFVQMKRQSMMNQLLQMKRQRTWSQKV